ncbi:MAG: 4Fe-4S binding protein [Aminipila sp.]
MKISVLSGKGGTGKTFVSVNLASVCNNALYVDCDVEEPNGNLFFKAKGIAEEQVSTQIPLFNKELCIGCRKCVDFCKFSALAYIKDCVYIFEELCHSCGGCILLCPQKALGEKEKVIGKIQNGVSEGVSVMTGILNTGETTGVPIIKRLLDKCKETDKTVFFDCPPGSSCSVMESIKDADYCIIIAEPTIFGEQNLSMVYELVKLFKKPHGVILNKYINGSNPSERFCERNKIKILGKIPFDNNIGELNSKGYIVAREREIYKDKFEDLLQDIIREAADEAIINSER